MIPLSLQPAIPPAPLDGISIPAQSRDSESLQTLSFGEVLKVEEKKLQHEQETSPQSIAALFVTIQPPVMIQSISGFFDGAENVPNQTNDQTAPIVDSVQSAPTSPQQAAPLPNKPAVTWRTTVIENIIPSGQASAQDTNGSVSVKKVETRTTNETVPTIKVTTSQPKNITLNESTESLPDNYESPRPQATLGASMFETSAAKVQRPAIKANIPVTKVVLNQNENNPVIGKVASDQVTLSDSEGSLPNNSKTLQSQKTLPQSDMDFVSTNETEQPASKINVPVAKVAIDHVTLNDSEGSLPNGSEALRSQKTLPQSDMHFVSTNETPQPVSKVNVPVAKVAIDQVTLSDSEGSLPNNSKALQSQKTLPQSDMEIISTNETEQPVSQVNVQVAKVAIDHVTLSDSEGSRPNGSEALRSQKTLPQSNIDIVSTDENVQPASKVNVSTEKVVDDEVEQKIFIADVKSIQEKITAQNVTLSDSEVSRPNNSETLRSQRALPQSDIMDFVSTNETPQPATKVNVPTVKVVFDSEDEVDQKEFAIEAKVTPERVTLSDSKGSLPNNSEVLRSQQTLPQSDMEMVSANETPQPASKVNVPAAKVVVDSEVEVDQKAFVFETKTILTQGDNQSATSDNITVESLLQNRAKPQVKNEAFALGQENITASVKPIVAGQSDEKTSPKEIDKKPALDMDPTFAVTGMGRETVEVKAAEKLSTNKIDPFAMDVIEQITSQMKARIKSSETSIHMQLNPSELGAIEVQVTHTAQGVSVSFITEQASTGQLIESQVNQLRQSLKEAGVQLANLNISQQRQSNQEGGAFRQGQSFIQNPRRDVPRTEPVEERMRPQRIGSLTGEIDYLI